MGATDRADGTNGTDDVSGVSNATDVTVVTDEADNAELLTLPYLNLAYRWLTSEPVSAGVPQKQ